MKTDPSVGELDGMMLETSPMPGTRGAKSPSEVPSVIEVIGGVRKIPKFILIAIAFTVAVAITWLVYSFGLNA